MRQPKLAGSLAWCAAPGHNNALRSPAASEQHDDEGQAVPHCTIALLARPVVGSRWSPCRFRGSAMLLVALLDKGLFVLLVWVFLTIFASRFGHCRGQPCVFCIPSDAFRIVIHCRNRTHFVKSENGFKFSLKDVSLACLWFFFY